MADEYKNYTSRNWSLEAEGMEECDMTWGLGKGSGDMYICSPIPYKVLSSDVDHFLTSSDFNYIIELKGTREGQINFPLDAPTLDLQETTVVSSQRFFTYAALGVTINNYPGPQWFFTGPLSDGVMFKKIGDNTWLGLGDLVPFENESGVGNTA